MTEEIHAMAGPYVLDALPDEERVLFEQHLAYCAACTAEVVEFREAAVKLSAGVAVSPPPHLKAAVMTSIAQVEQLPPLSAETHTAVPAVVASRPAFGRRSLLALAAAAIVVAGAGGVAVDQYRENNATKRTADRVAAVLAQPDARTVRGSLNGGGEATMVASAGQDAAVVVLRDLPALPSRQTYQLWLIDNAKAAHSVGLAEGDLTDQTKVIAGGVAGKVAFGVTVEPKGGSQQPTMPAAVIISMA